MRDARIPLATAHPKVSEWVKSRPLIVAMVRTDLIPKVAMRDMISRFEASVADGSGPPVVFINGKRGTGVRELSDRVIGLAGSVNDRRERMGMTPRPVRAAIIGYPNVGKSTLINRILGKRLAKAENMPGVTRTLSWIRLGTSSSATGGKKASSKVFELLDSPGIIPPGKQVSIEAALLLAICNQIGQASYDKIRAAKALISVLNGVFVSHPHYVDMNTIEKRYKIPFRSLSTEAIFEHIAENLCQDCDISAANKLLGDFRKGLMGYNILEPLSLPTSDTRSPSPLSE